MCACGQFDVSERKKFWHSLVMFDALLSTCVIFISKIANDESFL